MNDIRVEQWDEAQFKNAQESWANLLADSDSDKLFMSWEWLHTWWCIFGKDPQMQLQLLVVLNGANKLIGIAPLYLIVTKTKKLMTTKRLQFMGNVWRGQSTMRTELQDFIVDKQYSNQVIRAFFQDINKRIDWDEFVLSDLDKNSQTYKLLIQDRFIENAYYRNAEESESYYLKIAGSFDGYCKSLGKNTRLKFYNRRKLLEKIGEAEYVEVGSDNIELQFALLNSLHKKRWGVEVFSGERLEFNIGVAKLMAKKGQLNFSLVQLDKKPLSIQYNYIVDSHEYNIQAGFDESFHNKISLGYLHFGYAIESAFNKKLSTYDFLVGGGKNTPYKKRLTESSQTIVSMQIIRSRAAKILYRVYDWYRGYNR